MATGTGKTAVMGMVITWNVANVAAGGNRRHPGRYFTTFVAITPGHTVRERLAVTGSDRDDAERAALWFGALAALRDEGRLGRVHDFSATPMFIETTSSKKSVMFPWVISDFPLMDGIESGLVKIPRVPVDDDSDERDVAWRNLYRNTNPKTIRGDAAPPATTVTSSGRR